MTTTPLGLRPRDCVWVKIIREVLVVTPKEDLIQLEAELDAAVESSPLIQLPARTTLIATHHVLDGLANGNRVERTPGDPGAAESYGGRLFALAPVLERANTELGANVGDNMNAYAEKDPDGSALRFLVGYGHFCEVMPEVHRDLYTVSGDREGGFRLEHRTAELGEYEARDTMLWSLGATTAPVPPPLHSMRFDQLARTAPVLDPVQTAQIVRRLVAYYDRALQEPPLVPNVVFEEITGAGRAEFNRVRAACWAFADFAFGIAQALYALYMAGEKSEVELWEAHEWLSVCWTYTEFRRWLAEASDLPEGTVSQVLKPFILDLDHKDEIVFARVLRDGYLPPIALISRAAVTSPESLRLFLLERNVLFDLNRRDEERFGAVVAEHLEPMLLNELRAEFAAFPDLQVGLNCKWKSRSTQGEMDMLVYSRSENTAAHVQAKAALPPQGARMIRQVESRALEGLEQLQRFRELDDAEQSRILTAALGEEIKDAEVVDVLVSRSSFGTARLWIRAEGVALLNPALLRLVAAERKTAARSLSMRDLGGEAAQTLDRFVAEAKTRWENETMVVGKFTIELPMLRFDRDVVREWQTRVKNV